MKLTKHIKFIVFSIKDIFIVKLTIDDGHIYFLFKIEENEKRKRETMNMFIFCLDKLRNFVFYELLLEMREFKIILFF